MTQDLATWDAIKVVAAFKDGTLSPGDYVSSLAERVEAKFELNALSYFDTELAVRLSADAFATNPDGALSGLPIVAKDNINTTHYPTSAGTKALLNNTPTTEAGVVSRLANEGGVIGAKAGMHELAFGITSNNAVTGAIRNPADPSRIPGGSSGGTASAIAAGIFPAGLGSDTGGSCRIPAALCGIIGFRPTTGRYPGDGVVPISHTRDTVGPLARSMRDIALFDRVLSGQPTEVPEVDLSDVTLGVPQDVFYDSLDPHVAKHVEAQLRRLSAAGVRLVDVSLDPIWPHNTAFGFPVVFHEFLRDLPAYLKEHAPDISFDEVVDQIGSPDVAGIIGSQRHAGDATVAAYREAIDLHRPAMRRIYGQVFEENALDAIIFPTTPLPAAPIGADETVTLGGAEVPTFRAFVRNTDLGSNIGAPGLSTPCPVVDGLPVGIEVDGMPGEDLRLLSLATAIERITTNL